MISRIPIWVSVVDENGRRIAEDVPQIVTRGWSVTFLRYQLVWFGRRLVVYGPERYWTVDIIDFFRKWLYIF